jgi:hypothetical protein
MAKCRVIAAAVVALALGAQASMAASVHGFKAFAGKFKGTTTLNANGTTYNGPAALAVVSSADGQSATMLFNGSVISGGSSVPFSGNLLFALRTMSLSEIVFNVLGSNNGGVFGTYHVSSKSITFSGKGVTGSTNFNVNASIRTSSNRKKQKIVFNYTLSYTGGFYTYSSVLFRKISGK